MPTTAPPQFSVEQIQEILALIKESDSVELKLTVPESAIRSTTTALGADPLRAQLRQVVFFDTPELILDRHGVVVRARRTQGKADDSVVKLRPVVPSQLPPELRRAEEFRVEVDALPGGFVCSGALKRLLPPTAVRAALAGELPVRKLFSKAQRALFAEHAPEGVSIDDLSILGPIFVLKLRFTPDELGRRLAAEMWLYPDGSRILELSTRCATTEAFEVAAEVRAYLGGLGMELSGDQQTKTRRALEYFAEHAGS